MTKQHFETAAQIVDAIRRGQWTNATPAWAPVSTVVNGDLTTVESAYTRAVQTAEAFILLFKRYNPRFNEVRFINACGLGKH